MPVWSPRLKKQSSSSVELFPKQYEAVRFLEKHKCGALFIEQRGGKTEIVKRYLNSNAKRKQLKLVLIIAPKKPCANWVRHIASGIIYDHHIFYAQDIKGSRRADETFAQRINTHVQFLITNYESIRSISKQLSRVDWDLIIVDEGHRLEYPTTVQSRSIYKLIGKRRFVLTGTPLVENLIGAYGLFQFIKPKLFDYPFGEFKRRWCRKAGFMKKKFQVKAHLKERLLARIAPYCFTASYEEVFGKENVKPTVEKNVHVDLYGESQRIYDELERKLVAELPDGEVMATPLVITKMIKLQQICGGSVKLDDERVLDLEVPKMDWVVDYCKKMGKKKLVIFCKFVREIDKLADLLTVKGFKVGIIYGKSKDSAEVNRLFQETNKIQIIIAQIETGGEGIDLFAADTIIFYSLTFRYRAYSQAKKRIDGIGQKSQSMTILYMIARGTIDRYLRSALQRKRNVAKYVVNTLKRNSSYGKGRRKSQEGKGRVGRLRRELSRKVARHWRIPRSSKAARRQDRQRRA